jgi:hypothetical protein
MLATHTTPRMCWTKVSQVTEKEGEMVMLKPPYPYSMVKLFPSSTVSLWAIMYMGICVPSLLG